MNTNYKIIALIISQLMNVYLNAQQLDQIGEKGGIKINGGIGLSNQIYASNGNTNISTPPYTYLLKGNLNINVYGWNIPFSISVTNRGYTTGQPSNIVGISPSYKNLTMHAGIRNMTLSPYTLAGHTFTGGGIEYKLVNSGITFKAMSGYLLRAVEYDPEKKKKTPTYARKAGGLMVDYQNDQDQLKVIVFYAIDDKKSINSVPDSIRPRYNLNPQENMVYSIGFKKKISPKFSINGETAISGWVENTNGYHVETNSGLASDLLYLKNADKAQFYNALKFGGSYHFNVFSLGVDYERVEPEFRTLGAYNVVNDFENIALNSSTSFLKDKIQLSGRFGVQRNDLNGQKATTGLRNVSSLNVSVNASERLNFSLNYSSFNSITKVKPIEETYFENEKDHYLDTANFVQLSSSFNGNISYKISENDNRSHTLSSSSSYQQANNKQNNQRFGSKMINQNVNYNLLLKNMGLSLGTFINGSYNEYDMGNSRYIGAGVSGSYAFLDKKVNVSLTINNSYNYEKRKHTATLFGITNSYSYTPFKKHNISLMLRYSGRHKKSNAAYSLYDNNIHEYFIILGYRYSFGKDI